MGLLDAIKSAFRDPVDCVITVDDRPVVDLYPFLRDVTVELSRTDASTATLTFESQRDEHGRWSVQDSGAFALWQPIAIAAAFGAHHEDLFRGYIREINASYPADAADALVTIECQDESLALDREHVRKTCGGDAPTTDAAIIAELAHKHGLALNELNGVGLSNLVLHQSTTDIRFLRERAEANGYELYVRSGELYFGPMQVDTPSPQPTILVYAGPDTSCISLSIQSDGHRPNKIAFDLAPTEGTEIKHKEVSADLSLLGPVPAADDAAGLKPFTWILSKKGSYDEDELTARAQQIANDSSMRVRADGELDGTIYGHVLLPGLPVSVDGAGDTLGGVYYVDHVTHVIDTDGYRQKFRLLRNAFGDNLNGGGLDRLAGIR